MQSHTLPYLKALITGLLELNWIIGQGHRITFEFCHTVMFAWAHCNHWLVKRQAPSPTPQVMPLKLYTFLSMKVAQITKQSWYNYTTQHSPFMKKKRGLMCTANFDAINVTIYRPRH